MARGQRPWVISYPGGPPRPPQSCPVAGPECLGPDAEPYLPAPFTQGCDQLGSASLEWKAAGRKEGQDELLPGPGKGWAVPRRLGQSGHQSPSRLPCDPCSSDPDPSLLALPTGTPCPEGGFLGLLGFRLPPSQAQAQGCLPGSSTGLGKLDL